MTLLAGIEASRAEFEAGKSVPLTREFLAGIAEAAKKRASGIDDEVG